MKVFWEKNQSLSLQGFLTLERLGDTSLEVRVKYLSQIWGCREGDTPYLEGGRRQKQHQERERVLWRRKSEASPAGPMHVCMLSCV